MNVGKSLRIALASKGMKQIELAEKMGISRQHVSNWTRRQGINKKNLDALCQALDMKLSEFIALGEDK